MVAANRRRIDDFAHNAAHPGFKFHSMSGRGRSAYLDEKQPAMKLADPAVDKEVPGLGAAYQRHLSSVAHGKPYGLTGS